MSSCRLLIALIMLAPAWAHGAPLRVSIGPIEQVNLPDAEVRRFHALLEQVVRETQGLVLGRALDRLPCEPREGACLRRLRPEIGSDRLLLLRVGRIADTVVIRLTVHDLTRGVRQGSWQEVLKPDPQQRERAALQRMVAGFAPPPPPPPRPWYGRWWVWTLAGVVVAGAVTAAVLATRPSEHEPDRTIPWPP